MSMVLLDISAGEIRGPHAIPFASELNACDEMDGDSVAGDGGATSGGGERGRTRGGRGVESGRESGRSPSRSQDSGAHGRRDGQAMSADNGSLVTDSSGKNGRSSSSKLPNDDCRGDRPPFLSLSLQQPINLECQAYTNSHLEALRLRREAGKGRAYSFNDSLLQGRALADIEEAPTRQPQWKPTLEVLDCSSREASDAALNTDGIFMFEDVQSKGSREPGVLDIIMPDLSLPDSAGGKAQNAAARGGNPHAAPAPASAPVSGPEQDVMQRSTQTKTVGTNTTAILNLGEHIRHSTSCTSIMSSDTTKTLKSGNLKSERHRAAGGVLLSTPSKGAMSASSTPAKDCASSMATRKMKDKFETHEIKSLGRKTSQHPQQAAKLAIVDTDKSNQTMTEYVVNDLLNIDSRNHDGSASDDIDENMEEFLRIPPKLEWLMGFSLAVCLDSFLYTWTMLPLKFVWGLVCLACSLCSFGKGVRGVRFRRR